MVYAAVGIHAHEAARFDTEKDGVRTLLDDENVVAVGEIGLDYVRDSVSREAQLSAFHEQLAWAAELGLPVSIHNRDADTDILEALQAVNVKGILHCFSGTWGLASSALDLGCFISFAGNLTFPKADSLRAVARRVPLERVLVESDSPVLAPQPRRGRRNEPSYVTWTAETLAGISDVPLSRMGEMVSRTAADVFGWGQP